MKVYVIVMSYGEWEDWNKVVLPRGFLTEDAARAEVSRLHGLASKYKDNRPEWPEDSDDVAYGAYEAAMEAWRLAWVAEAGGGSFSDSEPCYLFQEIEAS